ncbi:MAG: hypothetical protein CL758_01525 [Chloroflexi bacterium]|nr:hypothetical protein [Chloroflexota bacterium]|tara:strand:+ start:310 stop:573 length:264 start_codon:yes stop_codon:yes gene_type:complete
MKILIEVLDILLWFSNIIVIFTVLGISSNKKNKLKYFIIGSLILIILGILRVIMTENKNLTNILIPILVPLIILIVTGILSTKKPTQ